jgi:putative membrane protein
MYYGGDLVEIGLAAVVALQWYAAGGRALARAQRRTEPSASGAAATGTAV